jgi:uncharacterized protein (UPF0332 family)
MTDPNREANAQAEMRRAEDALRAAEALAAAALYNDATSRAYYVAFHAGLAILVRLGEQARSHRGVESLLRQHAAATGLLTTEDMQRLARLQQRRSTADYSAAEHIPADAMDAILSDARAFLDAARAAVATVASRAGSGT